MNCNYIKNIINSMLFALCSLLLLLVTGNADGGTYLDSAHGDSTSGVNRSAVTGMPYPDSSSYPTGHCGHCHEQHASIGGSEPAPVGDAPNSYFLFKENLGVDTNELCYACHETFSFGAGLGYGRQGIYQGKTKFNDSIHFLDSNMLWSPDPVPPGPQYNDAGNCNNCHNPHGYNDGNGNIEYMLFARDSKTGDSPPYERGGCEACHDGTQAGSIKDVKTQLSKLYAHPTHTYNDRHALPETSSSFGPANRHAECTDCHNPHAMGPTGDVHTVGGANGNNVSDILLNMWGVEPTTWPSIWTQPTTFTERKPPAYPDGAQYEYQICFKCHSYYGLGADNQGTDDGIYWESDYLGISSPSGNFATDVAREFNKNNRSVHPVVVSLNNQTGSLSPKSLGTGWSGDHQLKTPWRNYGTQTMYCSDCHGANNESLGADGPHGSTIPYMLKGTGKYWPTKSDGTTLWRLRETDITDNDDLFCKNCHVLYDSGEGNWTNYPHDRMNEDRVGSAMYCVNCHIVIPHGARRSRLIGYEDDPSVANPDVAPYNYNGSYLKVNKMKKSNGSSYERNSCFSRSGVSPCHNRHDDGSGGGWED